MQFISSIQNLKIKIKTIARKKYPTCYFYHHRFPAFHIYFFSFIFTFRSSHNIPFICASALVSLYLFCSNSLVIHSKLLVFKGACTSILYGSKQVEILLSYPACWMNSCKHQSLPLPQRLGHSSQSSWCLVSLFIKNPLPQM